MGVSGDKESSPSPSCHGALMDLKECIQDSPNFRAQLKVREKEIADIETRLEKVVNACDRMVSTGVLYNDACRVFSTSIKDLAAHFSENEVIAGTLKRFYDISKELQSFYSILFDQAQRSVQSSLRAFLSGELKKVKETKKVFHKVSDELNTATNKNANVPRNKVQEGEEASVQLANSQNMFSHHAIDYGYQINIISCIKGHEILSNLLSYMRAQFTFFHQGYDLLHEFDPFMRQVGTQVDIMRKEATESVREMDSRHSLVASHHLQDGSHDSPLLPLGNPTLTIENSGYLFKKPRGNKLFTFWSRRWFILKDNKMVYQSESKDEEYSIVAEDMRMCTVKYADDLERRFCFEVVTPWRSCTVQADSDALRRKWVTYIEASIARALRVNASNKKIQEDEDFKRRSMIVDKGEPIQLLQKFPKILRKDTRNSYSMGLQFLNVPGNDKCVDCNGENPTWASINLGIMLCIECSGIHRSLGVHISKVRSVTLDDWEPEIQKIMIQLGNSRVNAIYEYDVPSHVRKPTQESSRTARETFIRLKYVEHAFVHPHPKFERTEVPLPPPTIFELLAPSRSTSLSFSGGSPKSPTRRSFSPSLRMRPSKLQKSGGSFRSSSHPYSASFTNISDPSTPEEEVQGTSLGGSGSLQLLADNLNRLEKSNKLKSWGNTSLSDKLRNTARKSSKRISAYAKSKITGARDKLRSKEKSPVLRQVHSDIEDDDDLISTSTPLLYSMSASTNNLSMYSTPPPKPPRTFVTKNLPSANSASDDESELFVKEGDDFSSDILSAIKEIGALCNAHKTDDAVDLPNGRIPGDTGEGFSKLTKSESFPQIFQNLQVEPRASLRLPPLRTIAEGQSSRAAGIPDDTTDHTQRSQPFDSRVSSSAPLMRKRFVKVSHSFDSSSVCCPDSAVAGADLSSSMPEADMMERRGDMSAKRFSILSTTSADFFSAESSEGSDSKPSSVCVSPDIPFMEPASSRASVSSIAEMDCLRVPSVVTSADDESFSTPPSTPNQLETSGKFLADGVGEKIVRHDEVDCSVDPVPQRASNEVSDNGSSQPKEDRTSQAKEDSTSLSEEDNTSLSKEDNTSLSKEDSTSLSKEDGTSQAKEDGTSQANEVANDSEAPVSNNASSADVLHSEDSSPFNSPTLKEFHPSLPLATSQLTPIKRMRSLTTSDFVPLFTTRPNSTINRSKDDNFETESKRMSLTELSEGSITSFSQQDFADIFNRVPGFNLLGEGEKSVSIPEENEENITSPDKDGVYIEGEQSVHNPEGDGENMETVSAVVTSVCTSPVPTVRIESVDPVIIPATVTPDEFLYSSVLAIDLPGILCAIAHGCKVNAVVTSPENGSKTPILLAIEAGNAVLTEYLFQNGAKLNCTDNLGRGCLHHAVLSEQSNIVVTLLKRGVQSNAKDSEGKDPLAYAIAAENGDMVTMLRMASFRGQAELKSDNRQSQYLEELQSEYFRDIEVATLVDPERSRKSTSDSSSVNSHE